ncbi:hypothetical protein [Streptomyces violascens]|uniref:Uncharacterized protein n=1 Tax=Streptomyces violascens TaxID=67381 RepID=A0ABQ3QEV6_9ACTN|nr:hypothetical protein [Streptomyces violascens]GGU46738.1 hypothetical protein GCM10010289_79030 [Streptomyces violascens]GHI35821.1 hypothetical protein Sviol_02290 [Streptomyces violascens]
MTTSKVGFPLSDGQAQAFGLPDDVYRVEGLIYREEDGTLVELPTTLAYEGLPIRWLDPAGHPDRPGR